MLKELFDLKPKKYGTYSYLELLPVLFQWKKIKVIIWGGGSKAYVLNNYLEKIYDIRVEFFIDACSDDESFGLFSKYRMVSQEEFQNMEKDRYFALIAIHGDTPQYVVPLLKEKGACFIINATPYTWPFKPVWYTYFKQHIQQIEDFHEELCDIRSREILREYLRTYIVGDRYKGETLEEELKYFGFDRGSRIFQLNSEDVWLNIGGAYGDTLYQAIKNEIHFKRIISFEADNQSFEQLKYNVSFMKKEYKDKIELLNILLGDKNSVDELYADDYVSFVNMDIEGAELNVLQGMTQIIQRCRPILAICLYHKAQDLVDIPQFIRRNCYDYKLYLRKYPTVYFYYFDGVNQVSETVLYAVPKERVVT